MDEYFDDMKLNPDFEAFTHVIGSAQKLEGMLFRINQEEKITQQILREALQLIINCMLITEKSVLREIRKAYQASDNAAATLEALPIKEAFDKATYALEKVQKQDDYIIRQFEQIVMLLNGEK